MIEAARLNAAARDLEGVVYDIARAEECVVPLLASIKKRDTLLILDPPRSGLDKLVTEALVAAPPRELIYVSCAPDTLSRDLAQLVTAGYEIKQVQLFDMFPRTACFETVVHAVR